MQRPRVSRGREESEFQRFVYSSIGRHLPLYGARAFEDVPTTFSSLHQVQVVPSDYSIGAGDELRIEVWGQVNLFVRPLVDRNGQIFIPRVGVITVAGVRYSQLQDFLTSQFSRIFRNFNLNVSLARLRYIQVFVTGRAQRPGKYLRQRAGVEAIPVVADLRFVERLRAVFETIRPEIVFHAAAHKHVHLMETNPCEAVTNNVTGTRNLVERSVAGGVSRFVQISTDKAAQPTSIMGASKRVCEMVVQAHEGRDPTLFSCVRFGNVLGSRGSVVPIFQRQIMNGGPVTVTHPDAKRFLMTIPEAVCLVIQAGTLAHGKREIFVLDMGEPVLIKKLAQDLIELSGLSPNQDVKIEITGMKPGEKLTEVLLDESREHLRPTGCSKIQTIAAQSFDVIQFADRLRRLEKAAWDGDADEVRRNLVALNMGFLYEESKRAWPGNFRAPAAASGAPAASIGL